MDRLGLLLTLGSVFFGCGIITLSDTEAVARQSRQDRWFPLALDNNIIFSFRRCRYFFPIAIAWGC